ncbi:MAG TPA: hypothetical protein VE198_20815 [Actinoallomurus sp.]|nr:hypothetical protein [Actinoallomurus sp.]
MSTQEPFDPDLVRREVRIIKEGLHRTAVRITGGDPDRLEIAARHVADAGPEVWFCPFIRDLTVDESSPTVPSAPNGPVGREPTSSSSRVPSSACSRPGSCPATRSPSGPVS